MVWNLMQILYEYIIVRYLGTMFVIVLSIFLCVPCRVVHAETIYPPGCSVPTLEPKSPKFES